MVQEELASFRERLNEIKQGSSQLKVGRMQVLLKDLKGTYSIPSYASVICGSFSKEQPEVAELYLEVIEEISNVANGGRM